MLLGGMFGVGVGWIGEDGALGRKILLAGDLSD